MNVPLGNDFNLKIWFKCYPRPFLIFRLCWLSVDPKESLEGGLLPDLVGWAKAN
jgi:hypothetical protein